MKGCFLRQQAFNHHGLCVEEGPYHLLDDRVLLPLVPLSIFFGIPETDRQDTIRFCIRYQKGLIRESGLLIQNRQYFVVDEGSEVSCLSRLPVSFTSPCKHRTTPSALVLKTLEATGRS